MPDVHTRLTQEYEATPHSKANQKKEYQKAYQKEYYKIKKTRKSIAKARTSKARRP